MDRSHAFPQGFNESPPSTCTGFLSPTESMARALNEIGGSAAAIPLQSDPKFEKGNQIHPSTGFHMQPPYRLMPSVPDTGFNSDPKPTMDRSHAFPQGFNESPPSTCTGFLSPTESMARAANIMHGSAAAIPLQSDPKQRIQINQRTKTVGTSSTDQSREVSLHINELAILRKHLKTNKAFSSTCCIYRVPARLRWLNEEAYTPRVVSIGPIHHGKYNLKAMEDHKIMYLQQFIEQSKVHEGHLINIFKGYETKIRDCYAETSDRTKKDFAIMILLDAVFIIMVLLKFNNVGESRESGSGDQIFSPPFKFDDVVFDMCLLENQLPFFFLEILLELYPIKNCTIMELTFELLKKIWPNWVKEDSREKINLSGVLHFVDFLRKCQQLTEHLSKEKPSFSSAPTAMELHQSGVKFKNPEGKSLFDVSFKNGILEIPQLIIDDHTEILLRNLQAFEQCHHKLEDKFVSDYITFIGFLVRAPNDVEVLARNKILKNMLNSVKAVSNLVHDLDKENVVSEKSFLGGVCKELTEHCEKPWHEWKAKLKQDYFQNPWTAISVAAATFLIILAVIQTVCSILQL